MPPNLRFSPLAVSLLEEDQNDSPLMIRCAILGCGMMGREHISYIMGYPTDLRIDFLVDPFEESLERSLEMMNEFRQTGNNNNNNNNKNPILLKDQDELLHKYANEIDLLVVASPNYLHTPTLLRWANYDVTILVEKPVAVSEEQTRQLEGLFSQDTKARIWVAMEYRYIPAIAKLISLLHTVGDIKMVTIRENRYPFLHKIGKWNRDRQKTGDTLVEKCCHFFDLFRLITGQESRLAEVRALAQRGLNYHTEPPIDGVGTPIIDSAYVTMPFHKNDLREQDEMKARGKTYGTIGCLELCMYAEGSRHQEEIIVTGTKGRLEAYLPENKVFSFVRPNEELWSDRSLPPPPSSVTRMVYDCSDVKDVHGIETDIPTHGGFHYSSTAVEWFRLLGAIKHYSKTNIWKPEVSLEDGIRAVEIGLQATSVIVNEQSASVSAESNLTPRVEDIKTTLLTNDGKCSGTNEPNDDLLSPPTTLCS